MNCFEAIDVMGEAAEDRLERALQPGFEEHLSECDPCKTYFEQLRLSRGALGQLRRPGPPNASRFRLLDEFSARFPREDE